MWIKNLRQVYSLVVCLVASLVLMFSLGTMLSQSVSFFVPEMTRANEFSNYYSNESYLRDFESRQNVDSQTKERIAALSESELTSKRLQEQDQTRTKISAAACGTILETLVWFFVAFFFFIIHWSMFRRSERQGGNNRVISTNDRHPIRPRFKT